MSNIPETQNKNSSPLLNNNNNISYKNDSSEESSTLTGKMSTEESISAIPTSLKKFNSTGSPKENQRKLPKSAYAFRSMQKPGPGILKKEIM